jgi:hypothetical protein
MAHGIFSVTLAGIVVLGRDATASKRAFALREPGLCLRQPSPDVRRRMQYTR